MSNSLPIVFFNLGGEMLYIIQQRLVAQNIDCNKSDRVINEILVAMYNDEIVSEMFKSQPLMKVDVIREMFEKLAHSSIMKLNEESMKKLFDLMIMVFKYQLMACSFPIEMVVVTINHFESLIEIASLESTKQLILKTRATFINYYSTYNNSQLQQVRYAILNLFQDIKTKVSIFLREGIQESDGKFVIRPKGFVACECQIPGEIRYFDENGQVIEKFKFNSDCDFQYSNKKTHLGMNIYTKEAMSMEEQLSRQQSFCDQTEDVSGFEKEDLGRSKEAKKELDLLAKLIGRQEVIKNEISFWLNLGNEEPEQSSSSNSFNQQKLDLTDVRKNTKNLENIFTELDINESQMNDSKEDLLALMDS